MTQFLLANGIYIAIVLGGLVALGFSLTYLAASGRLDRVPTRRKLRSRTLLVLGVTLFVVGIVFFVGMLFLNATSNGPLSNSWAGTFITRFVIMSLAFSVFLVVLGIWVLNGQQSKE